MKFNTSVNILYYFVHEMTLGTNLLEDNLGIIRVARLLNY